MWVKDLYTACSLVLSGLVAINHKEDFLLQVLLLLKLLFLAENLVPIDHSTFGANFVVWPSVFVKCCLSLSRWFDFLARIRNKHICLSLWHRHLAYL